MMAMLRVLSLRIVVELKRKQIFLRLTEGYVYYYVAMSCVQELVRRFEAGTVRLVDFGHAEHLEVALWYLLHHSLPEATARIRSGLRGLLEKHHMPHAYSEETTIYWIGRIDQFLCTADRTRPVDELAADLVQSCTKSSMLS